MENIANVPATMESDGFLFDLSNTAKSYCSMVPASDKEATTLFNATNNPDKRISDCINEVIEVKHVYCEEVVCKQKDTGELQICPRVVLIDAKGIGYQSVSFGIFSSLKKLISLKGEPKTWEKPVKIKVKQLNKGDRSILTFILCE